MEAMASEVTAQSAAPDTSTRTLKRVAPVKIDRLAETQVKYASHTRVIRKSYGRFSAFYRVATAT